MTLPKKPTRRAAKDEREVLTAALLDHLVLPGIKAACLILRKEMKTDETSGSAARMIIKVAQDLVQKGFPEPTAEDKAEKIREELRALENDSRTPRRGGKEGSEPDAAPAHMGENGSESGLLPGEEDL